MKTAPSGPPVDARILAHYGVERQPPLRPQLAVEVTPLDRLLKRRLDLAQALHQEQTRLSEMAGRPGLAPQVEESLRQVLEALTQALAGIEQAIEELTARHEPFPTNRVRLLALPGVGPKVVLPLLVKLCQWHNLTNGEGDAAGLVAYSGHHFIDLSFVLPKHRRPSPSFQQIASRFIPFDDAPNRPKRMSCFTH